MDKQHIERSIKNAKAGKSTISKQCLELEGMTTRKCKHLFNNLAKDCAVVEIGSHTGSTSFAWASAPNSIVYCYDDFSQHGNHVRTWEQRKSDLGYVNVKLTPEDHRKHVDSFDDDYFDIVFYDGNHKDQHTLEGLNMWWPKLSAGGVFVMDDYERQWDSTHININSVTDKWVKEHLGEIQSTYFLSIQDGFHNGLLLIHKK